MRERWLALLRELLPASAPIRRIPLNIDDGRLLGGLDLAATLAARRPVADRGLLLEAHGGIVLLAMAERIGTSAAARITGALDTAAVTLERDGLTLSTPLTFGAVALDEGIEADERPPEALLDRLAFHLDLAGIRGLETAGSWHDADDIASARARLAEVRAGDAVVEALCATALALGIPSLRAPVLALRVARAAAALDGRREVSEDDATLAGRLVLAPRARALPAGAPADDDAAPDEEERNDGDPAEPGPDRREAADAAPADAGPDATPRHESESPLDDVVLAAARSAIPEGVLALLAGAADAASGAKAMGRAGAIRPSGVRGRPAGVRRGIPRSGARLNVVETLRAAAPWQRLRGRDPSGKKTHIEVRPGDFRISRFKQRSETTTIFVVDASGSSALNRLAEAKGAVERLLADCYVRRDRVAMLAFRGRAADVLLPPTRSLVRAQRSLASLPGGGGTPLASGIDAATVLAIGIQRRGGTPTVVLLTDGRANIARDGAAGRTRACDDALAAARQLRAANVTALLVDTSPQPLPFAATLAAAMGARYLALPHADATLISGAIRNIPEGRVRGA